MTERHVCPALKPFTALRRVSVAFATAAAWQCLVGDTGITAAVYVTPRRLTVRRWAHVPDPVHLSWAGGS